MKLTLHIRKRWKRKDMISLLDRLSMYLEAGLTVDDSLALTCESVRKPLASSFEHVRKDIEKGLSLTRSLESHIGISKTLAAIIDSGYASGRLGAAIGICKDSIERQDELIKKCVSAMLYPAIIGTCTLALTLGLMRGIMPQIEPMLRGMNVSLPLITRISIAVSDGLVAYGVYVILIVVMGSFMCMWIYRKYEHIRKYVQRIVESIPIVGKMVSDFAGSVFIHSCGSLIGAGISVESAFFQAASAISLLPLRSRLLAQEAQIGKGVPLGHILAVKGIPRSVGTLVSAGERTGTLAQSLLRSGDMIERELDTRLKRLTSLIEPILMLGMGGTVGMVALSIMMPIYDISKTLTR